VIDISVYSNVIHFEMKAELLITGVIMLILKVLQSCF